MLLLALLVACTGDKPAGTADTGAPGDWAPAADYADWGPHAAGTTDIDMTGSTGVELSVQIWYPAESDADPVTYSGLLPGEALEGATPACDGTRPVLLFSHGSGGIRWQSPEITEHLASHGYVVVAPDHTGNTYIDQDDSRFAEVVERRPQDLLDAFEAAADTLPDCIDAGGGFAVAGHSFGGYTAYALGGAPLGGEGAALGDLSDDRVWAIAALAPWGVGGILLDGMPEITVPVMTLTGTRDTTTPIDEVSGLHGALTTTPRYFGEWATAGHYSFSPLACQTGSTDNGCADDDIDLDLFLGQVNTSLLAFFDSVLQDPSAMDWRAQAEGELTWTDVR